MDNTKRNIKKIKIYYSLAFIIFFIFVIVEIYNILSFNSYYNTYPNKVSGQDFFINVVLPSYILIDCGMVITGFFYYIYSKLKGRNPMWANLFAIIFGSIIIVLKIESRSSLISLSKSFIIISIGIIILLYLEKLATKKKWLLK